MLTPRTTQLIMGASNPRDVAYIFRDYMRKIHAKARANDPSFIKIAVLAGRVGYSTVATSRPWAELS